MESRFQKEDQKGWKGYSTLEKLQSRQFRNPVGKSKFPSRFLRLLPAILNPRNLSRPFSSGLKTRHSNSYHSFLFVRSISQEGSRSIHREVYYINFEVKQKLALETDIFFFSFFSFFSLSLSLSPSLSLSLVRPIFARTSVRSSHRIHQTDCSSAFLKNLALLVPIYSSRPFRFVVSRIYLF